MKRTRASNFKNVIGERVRLARAAMKPPISQDDLSGKLARRGIQITQTSLSKLENRQRAVLDYEVSALADFLRVPIGWLFEGEGKTKGGR